jgi:glycosyltransferase involved in cell wall biosynthesis
MPKISFLIATKNRAKVIIDTLNSLIGQTEQDWEAIIVDDNGEDETKAVVAKFSDERLRYFKLLPAHGMGASCARNFACIQAKSDIVAIMDSDDVAYPKRAELTIKAFSKDKDLALFYGEFDLWYEKTGIIKDRDFPVYEFDFERLKKHNYIPHSTVAIKKSVLTDNPYNQYFKISEDYELYTRFALKGYKFGSTTQKLLKYRINDDNISIGEKRTKLQIAYHQVVRMARGWIEFDQNILKNVEDLEKEMEKNG